MILEICAANYTSAEAAATSGAHRVELCQELAIGGITPSYGLMKEVINALDIPVFVLIRPRSGHFTYSDAEFNSMCHDISIAQSLGASGIVSGVLDTELNIDIKRTKALMDQAKSLPFTFHRAIDWTPDPIKATKQLRDLGVSRILSSGQAPSALEGIETLKAMNAVAKDRLTILPGGGISSDNAEFFKNEGFNELHASASTKTPCISSAPLSMNSPKFLSDTALFHSDSNKIKAILNAIL